MRLAAILAILVAVLPISARAACYDWPIRQPLAHDGDTIFVTLAGLPPELASVSVRVAHVDTPEMKGKCESEIAGAHRAADRTIGLLRQAMDSGRPVLFCDPVWDKYGGRIRTSVSIDGQDLATLLIREGLGRRYEGEHRNGWCGGE